MVQDLAQLVSSCLQTTHALLILAHFWRIPTVTDKALIAFKEPLFNADCVDHLRTFIVYTRQGISLVRGIVADKTVF